jgi:hypothetical protein
MIDVETATARQPEIRRTDAWAVGLITFALLLFWWGAYFPGAFTVDSTQQWTQILDGVYQDWHPVFHTWVMGLLRSAWDTPGVVSLAQAVAFAAILGRLSRSFARLGVARWVAIGIPIVMASVPNSGMMTVAIWKDAPFSLSVLWAFAEVLALVAHPQGLRSSWAAPLRLGLALFGVFAFRANGLLVAGLILVACAWVFRRTWLPMLVVVAISVGGLVLVRGPLHESLEVWPTPAIFTYTLFVHDMGALITDLGDEMPAADREFLATILPLDRWSEFDEETNPDGLYYCRQATPLIFPPEMYPAERRNLAGELVPSSGLPRVARQNPYSDVLETDGDRFMEIWTRSVLSRPLVFIGHRLCVGGVAWSPVSVGGGRPFTVPLRIAENSLGITTQPVLPWLTPVLDAYSSWWGRAATITWRPALWIYAGFVSVWRWARRRGDLAWSRWLAVVPGFASWISVVMFTPGQSYRYLWPAHLCAVAALALWTDRGVRRARGRHVA